MGFFENKIKILRVRIGAKSFKEILNVFSKKPTAAAGRATERGLTASAVVLVATAGKYIMRQQNKMKKSPPRWSEIYSFN